MRLVFRWGMNSMDATFEVATSERRQSITDVDRNSSILRLNPFPLLFGVQDLQGSNGLSEKQRDGSKICVPWCVQRADFLIVGC